MFSLAKGLKIDAEEVEGGRCVRGNNRKFVFSVSRKQIKSGRII